ncbi:MAG: 3'(2'), 5'-bisphosphate nucleotidase [Oleiphilaceae bacterium]|jgi:3'(2'), 5'-bisphosphate nucleotidase
MIEGKNVEFLASRLKEICVDAGGIIMEVYHSKKLNTIEKSDKSFVTQADIDANNYIKDQLKISWPSLAVVSEEDNVLPNSSAQFDRFWLVDPLDGTKEFVNGSNEFTVNIALIEHSKPVLGVVYQPAIDLLYWGGDGFGAFKESNGAQEAIFVSRTELNQLKRVIVSKSHFNDDTQFLIDFLGEVKLVYAGSSLKFCKVAEGLADIYPRLAPTCEWDTAAAQAVLEGAGGIVVDMSCKPLRYGKSSILNPSFIASSSLEIIKPLFNEHF